MAILKRYATATYVDVPLIDAGTQNFAVSGDFTHAAGDTKISIDGGAAANATNAPTAIVMGAGAYWRYQLTAVEVTGKTIVVTTIDTATKAVEDQSFTIETYGHESAEHPNLGVPVLQYGQSVTGTLTASAFSTNLSGPAADQLNRRVLKFLSGSCAGEQVLITDFVVTNGVVTVAPPLTTAPANTDRFVVL